MRPVEVRERVVRVEIALIPLHREPDVRHVRPAGPGGTAGVRRTRVLRSRVRVGQVHLHALRHAPDTSSADPGSTDRKSTRLNSSHLVISYAVFCLKKKNWILR